MTSRLKAVLSPDDLPAAELYAAQLDGDLFRVGDCFAPIDQIERPLHRARAVLSGFSDRLIAEQYSAAWIWGASEKLPLLRQFCVTMNCRVGHEVPVGVNLREVVIASHEIAVVDGFKVTTPRRTAIDLARFSALFDDHEKEIVTRLAAAGDFTLAQCLEELTHRRNLPNKRQAIARLNRC
ncbi:MAG: type IV toxin-antitoxin system AbiEi family antitoxin [Rhodoglobus sp.]